MTDKTEQLFSDYYADWIDLYKNGAIRKVTLDKYYMTLNWIKKIAPDLRLCDIDRNAYQRIINEYAKYHEKQTTMDFHHQIKGAVMDAVDERLIDRNPTTRIIIKGKPPRKKKPKFLNQFELHTLIKQLKLNDTVNWDWLIFLIAKTGLRFAEALAVTPKDFDFEHQMLNVNKTWDYKSGTGFAPTKNKSSNRKVRLDWPTMSKFAALVQGKPQDEPLFIFTKTGRVYNSTVNDLLTSYCRQAEIPVISIHGLRHTHASILLFAGVSIASVARRLGHANMTTTQKIYLHIIQELENQDIDLIMRSLSPLV